MIEKLAGEKQTHQDYPTHHRYLCQAQVSVASSRPLYEIAPVCAGCNLSHSWRGWIVDLLVARAHTKT